MKQPDNTSLVLDIIILLIVIVYCIWSIYRYNRSRNSQDVSMIALALQNIASYNPDDSLTTLENRYNSITGQLTVAIKELEVDYNQFDKVKNLVMIREQTRQQIILARYVLHTKIMTDIIKNNDKIQQMTSNPNVKAIVTSIYDKDITHDINELANMITLFNETSSATLPSDHYKNTNEHFKLVTKQVNEHFTEHFTDVDIYNSVNELNRLVRSDLNSSSNKYTDFAASINDKIGKITLAQSTTAQTLNSIVSNYKLTNDNINSLRTSMSNQYYSKDYIDAVLKEINNTISTTKLDKITEQNKQLGTALTLLGDRITALEQKK